jgi:hypothetical protein
MGLVDIRVRTDFDEPAMVTSTDGLDRSDGDRPLGQPRKVVCDFDDARGCRPTTIAGSEVVVSEQRQLERFGHRPD